MFERVERQRIAPIVCGLTFALRSQNTPIPAEDPQSVALRMGQQLHVLAAIDMDLGAVNVGTRLTAQHIDNLGDLVRRAEAV